MALIAQLGYFVVKCKRNNHTGHHLTLEFTIDNTDYDLINIYNTNTETEQIQVHLNFHLLLNSLDIY